MYEVTGHKCTLDMRRDAADDIGGEGDGGVWRRAAVRAWARYCLVSERDARAHCLFRSRAMLSRERRRHAARHPTVLHPLSRLRLVWEAYMASLYLLQTLYMPITFAKVSAATWPLLTAVDVSACADMLLNMWTGYMAGAAVVLDLRAARLHYLYRKFPFDLLATLALFRVGGDLKRGDVLCLVAFKVFRAYSLIKYTENCLAAINWSPWRRTATRVALLGVTYVQYNATLQFLLQYGVDCSCETATMHRLLKQISSKSADCSWMTLANLWTAPTFTRYAFALQRAVAMLRQNTNMNLMERASCPETQYFTIIAWIVSKGLFYYCLFAIMSVCVSAEAAASKYYVMTRQVQTCAARRALRPRLARRIVSCYGIRFHSNFYVEWRIVGCAPTRLREDMALQVARQLVVSVPFLQRVPRALRVRVARALQPHVFLPGDVVLVVNTVGDCLYLIDKGTVSVHTESGCEVCHLQDGDYFGEVALVSGGEGRRSASVVAVTRCLLLRLPGEVFAECFATFPEAADAVRRGAATRLHATALAERRHVLEPHRLPSSI